jgi:hypothetical protein
MASNAGPGVCVLCQSEPMSRPSTGTTARLVAVSLVLVCLMLALSARAFAAGERGGTSHGEASSTEAPWPLGEPSVEQLSGALESSDAPERMRAIQRLAGLNTAAAVRRLAGLVTGRRAELGGREWLVLARALAPRAREPEPEIALAQLLEREPAEGDQAALLELARGTAALALAQAGSEAALGALASALRTRGPAAAAASEALRAHPPAELDRLLSAPGEPSVELARVLGQIGDERAFDPLRAWVRSADSAEVRAAAALALTELGGLETVALARQWLGSQRPVLRRAALEILSLTQASDLGKLLESELGSPGAGGAPTLAQGLKAASELAPEFPLSSLDRGVLERLAAGAPAAPLGWALLGEQGSTGAIRQLELAVHQHESAFAATQVLAGLPGVDAHAALQRLLSSGTALPLSVRAAASRAARWHENFPGLEARIAALRTSAAPSDRAAGAWAASLASSSAARALLASEDVVQREAAANNGLWFDDGVIATAAALLGRAAPGRARHAFAFALSRPSGRRAVSSVCLHDLVAEGGSAAPLALRALASRDEPQFVAFAESFAQHADPVLRAHLARGLGVSDRPGAFGLLVRSYEFETDPRVRQAIVRALSGHSGRRVERTLDGAARLDPDPEVRSAARLALAGMLLSDPPSGGDFSWMRVAVDRAEQKPDHAAPARSLLQVLPGLALPIFADPAGVVVVGGVAPESFAMQHPSF